VGDHAALGWTPLLQAGGKELLCPESMLGLNPVPRYVSHKTQVVCRRAPFAVLAHKTDKDTKRGFSSRHKIGQLFEGSFIEGA
jgi:hypothetical protein